MTTDRDFCRTVLPDVSRTFALGIRLLPPALSYSVSIAYLICRIADTIEDSALHSIDERRTLLAAVERALANPRGGIAGLERGPWPAAERALMVSSDRVFREFSHLPQQEQAIVANWVREMISGMSASLSATGRSATTPFEDLADLHRYCYYVAGTVGHLLTDLFQVHSKRIDPARHAQLDALASDFGLGLQLTNVTRDMAEDVRDGRNFVPAAIWSAAALAPGDLFASGQEDASWRVAAPLADEAATYLGQALSYCCALPRTEMRVRFFCYTSLIFAARTLSLIEQQRADYVRGRRIKMTRLNVYSLLVVSLLCIPSNTLLRMLFRAVAPSR